MIKKYTHIYMLLSLGFLAGCFNCDNCCSKKSKAKSETAKKATEKSASPEKGKAKVQNLSSDSTKTAPAKTSQTPKIILPSSNHKAPSTPAAKKKSTSSSAATAKKTTSSTKQTLPSLPSL